MADRTLRLTVTAVADRSLSAVVQPLVDSVRRAEGQVTSSTRRMSDGLKRSAKEGVDPLGKSFDKAARDAERAFKQIEAAAAKATAKEAADAQRAAQAKVKAEQSAWDQRLRAAERAREQEARAAKRLHDEEERAILREAAAHERGVARKAAIDKRAGEQRAKDIASIASGTITNAMGIGRAAAGAALGLTKQIAGGMGANFDLGQMVTKSVSLESMATQISNSAFKEGGTREDPRELVALARSIGDQTASDPTRVLQGLSAYQGKTGDLATIKAGLNDLSRLAKASYTDLNDMIDAAGDVGNALGEVGQTFKTPEEKAAAIARVMRVIAAQGQVGAVEIKDLAVQMAKLSAASTSFEGSGEKNLEMMGALAQFARAKGGAASATQAATSVAGFVNTLKTPARQDAFKAMGIDVYSKTQTGMLKNPFELIMEALDKSAMDPRGFKTMFANVIGAKPAEALATVYRQAEVEKKGSGRGAVQTMLTDYMKPMGEEKINQDFSAAMATTESKTQLFNNQLERIAETMAGRLNPAMEALAPKVVEIADGMGKAVVWISQNLGVTVAAAITASMGKAALGTLLPKLMESAFKNAAQGNIGGANVSGGALGAAAATVLISYAAFKIGQAVIDVMADKSDKGQARSVDKDMEALNVVSEANAALRLEKQGQAKIAQGKEKGGAEGDAMVAEGSKMVADAQKQQAEALAHLQTAKSYQEGRIERAADPTGLFEAINPLGGKSFEDRGQEQNDAMKMDTLKGDLAQLNASIAQLSDNISALKPKGGPQEVRVTNMPTGSLVGGDGVEGIPPP